MCWSHFLTGCRYCMQWRDISNSKNNCDSCRCMYRLLSVNRAGTGRRVRWELESCITIYVVIWLLYHVQLTELHLKLDHPPPEPPVQPPYLTPSWPDTNTTSCNERRKKLWGRAVNLKQIIIYLLKGIPLEPKAVNHQVNVYLSHPNHELFPVMMQECTPLLTWIFPLCVFSFPFTGGI